jgi:hypothetical protein
MKTFTIILAAICLPISTLAAETEARRKAFVSSDIVPSVVSLAPESLTDAGDIAPRAYRNKQSAWVVDVWVRGQDGALKGESQVFVYVASTDTYELFHPIRVNYVATASVVDRGLAYLDDLKDNATPVQRLGGAVIANYYYIRTDELPQGKSAVVFDLTLVGVTGDLRVGMVVDDNGNFLFRNAM